MSDRPRCVTSQKMRYEAHKFRSVAVECEVVANPDNELSFHWSFNDTVPKYAQKVIVPIRIFGFWLKVLKCTEKILRKDCFAEKF